MPNRLASATSPYLLQHQDNPVDWYEWGEAATAAATASGRPILLSVGYSACHWCHVMAHESFEDEATAEFMNQHFVNVKVDREERPDVDRIYMEAVQAMTGRGGWPMTVFLTPDGKPFFAGTYFPKSDLHGHPSFRRVLEGIAQAWDERRDELLGQADRLTAAIGNGVPATPHLPGAGSLDAAFASLEASFDRQHGGFGGAPKFPQAPSLELLLREAGRRPEAASFLQFTLDAMSRGGIYDHLGGGFARYAVDAIWLVPHFEKMLYDNALLARIYLRGAQVTGDECFQSVAIDVLEYLLRDMTSPDGGFYSAEDADSEGIEGKYYVWDAHEFRTVVGDDAELVAGYFGVTPEGNFEGKNILHRPSTDEEAADRWAVSPQVLTETIAAAKQKLMGARSSRVRPGLDDKIVTAWNGLAMRAFAEAGAVLAEERYIEAARHNARFVLSNLRRPDGRLLRSWRQGAASIPGFCDDYAAYVVALYTLYQATGEVEWFAAAEQLLAQMIELFADPSGGFYATGDDAETLIDRPKNLMDNPTPSENSLAAEALVIHMALTADLDAQRHFDGILKASGLLIERYPSAVGHLLAVLSSSERGVHEVAIVGEDRSRLEAVVWETFRPNVVVAVHSGDSQAVPLVQHHLPHSGPARAYVCRQFVCDLPATDVDLLRSQLDS